MGEESRPSEAKARGCRGPIDRAWGGANVPHGHPAPERDQSVPTPALSSLRSCGRFAGSEKKCQGESLPKGGDSTISHPLVYIFGEDSEALSVTMKMEGR